jgi:glutathione synthase/RimK-type ligase-like ATP-grasp enzyme
MNLCMPAVAFATYRDQPGITQDDTPIAEALRRAGVTVTPVVWDSPTADWNLFDAVVIRSVWDYFHKPIRFENWVRGFLAGQPRLWNSPEAVLWNFNKRYLLDLAARGLSVVPTEYLTAGGTPNLRSLLERCGWGEAVVKPAIAADSYGAWRTSLSSADMDQARLREQLRGGDILVQSYMPEVASGGEWSLVFFGLVYSHAALKRPQSGDFRVQERLGGRTLAAEPDPDLVNQARSIVAAVSQPLLYARVDGVERDGRFILMELEIIEPSLFLTFGKRAAERFAAAILEVVTERA